MPCGPNGDYFSLISKMTRLSASAETGNASAKSIGAMNKISWPRGYCGNPPNLVGTPRAVRPK
jgi:hypothetical protein